ncbi:MAG: hypothetical protein JO354_01260 [Verrucomicrobia bacterium]|nr:hypothetical protein [Verrucomicrobiota bacterium]
MLVLRRWPWLILALVLSIVYIGLDLNGSSVGVWSASESAEPPKGLLVFKPRAIRSDEWCVWTPLAVSQARQHPRFPAQNSNVGAGKAPLLLNLPVAYYTTFFRPQLWGFFLWRFERGFSALWACKIFGLLFASAWFLRRIGVRDPLMVGSGALCIFFSAFVQWWFSSPTMLPELVATWMLLTGCCLTFFERGEIWQTLAAVFGFVYFGANFVLCLYPSFQLPLIVLSIGICAGKLIELPSEGRRGRTGLLITALALCALLVSLLPLWFDLRSTLATVAATHYPG